MRTNTFKPPVHHVTPPSRPAYRPPTPITHHTTPPTISRPSTPPVHHDDPPTRPSNPPPVTHHDHPPSQDDHHHDNTVTNLLITQSIINSQERIRRDEMEAEERRHRADIDEQERRHRAEMAGQPVAIENHPRVTIIDDPVIPDPPRERPFSREEAVHASIDEHPYYHTSTTREDGGFDWYKLGKVLVVGFLIALVPIVIVFGVMNYKAPAPRYHGAFAAGNIYVVNMTDANVLSCVASFDVFVTNDTNNYDVYWWLGNTTTLSGVYSMLGAIDPSLYYNDVVLCTTGTPPYTYSWDTITTGENYVWLPATP
jgi:hypothetical protein